ncbi:SufE family protein [Phormidium pseudopriestleyi FRX01]|uniref:SufE family protein n=1 Tax=Phormidium pseudopriestleyi FRX01 TaxID=1759528 RepID=A0ABS3FU76_9CYAN|nr:SufE family protein [Phormidium pseudopriestleyi]MBO0350171.1 SufE family protein [Phormidium pseudopriestleyi FRX01]
MTNDKQQIPEKLARIVQRFQRHSDVKKRYEQLLWYAKKLPPFPEEGKVPENKVPGCVSQVYVTAILEDGMVFFQGDSDAQIVKGLLGLLIEGLSGLSPETIIRLSPEFIQDTGLNVNLTPSRANGFYNIFQTLKNKASLYVIAEN